MKEKLDKKDEELIGVKKEMKTTKRELQSSNEVIERHRILESDIEIMKF